MRHERLWCLLALWLLVAAVVWVGEAAGQVGEPVDLSATANAGFRDRVAGDGQGGWTDQGGNDFRHMPLGAVSRCGVRFRVLDPGQHNGRGCVVLRGQHTPQHPEAVEVAVGRRAGAVVFLHTMAWSADEAVARYVFEYADGERVVAPIQPGHEIAGWWGNHETPQAKLAIASKNLQHNEVCLYAWSWVNPRPESVIRSIRLESTGSEATPIVVAISTLDQPVELTSEAYPGPQQGEDYLWIEAESPAAVNFVNQHADWRDEAFSGDRMLGQSMTSRDPDPEKRQQPAWSDGAYQLRYDFTVKRPGVYELWARTGPCGVYSPFDWRVDSGSWQRIGREDAFHDLWEVSFWQTLGWVRLGERDLTAGEHALAIRCPRPGTEQADEAVEAALAELGESPRPRRGRDEAEASPTRWLIQFDCFALTRGPFHPRGKLKPGQQIDRFPWDATARQRATDLTSERIADDGTRQVFSLDGLWMLARDQEPFPSPHAANDERMHGPITEVCDPTTLAWIGVQVPHRRDRPELNLLHRFWYRKIVSLPTLGERRVSLHVSEANYAAAVFVNGQRVAGHRAGYVPFAVDITEHLRPNARNEILIGVKGLYFYMKTFQPARPRSLLRQMHRELLVPGYPGWNKDNRDGLPGSVWLETHGPVHADHLFVQSDVARRQLTASAELTNASDRGFQGRVRFEVLQPDTGEVVATLPEQAVTLPGGQTREVAATGDASGLTPWQPFDGRLYTLRVRTLDHAGQALDIADDLFGYRQVTLDGKHLRLNGERINFRSVITGEGRSLDEALAIFRRHHCNTLRLPHAQYTRFFDHDPQRSVLRHIDAAGIPTRLNSQINGMFITLATDDERFWRYSTEYFRKFIKAYRNHPSVIVWTAENELDLISNMANREPPKRKLWAMMQHAEELDPTRPVMADGAGDLLGEAPICNWHYPEVGPIVDPNDRQAVQVEEQTDLGLYPDNAYTFNTLSQKCRIRPWDRQRPLWVGETYFYSGKVSEQAWIGGDQAMAGRQYADAASERFLAMLAWGYRWQNVAGFNLFSPTSRLRGPRVPQALAPVALGLRQYNRHFYADRPLRRDLKLFNDARDGRPLRVRVGLEVAGRAAAEHVSNHRVEPGFATELSVTLKPPEVAERTAATLSLAVNRGEQTDQPPLYRDHQPVWLHPRIQRLDLPKGSGPVHVWDPQDRIAPTLTRWGVQPRAVSSLAGFDADDGLLVVGPGAIQAGQSRQLKHVEPFVAAGGRVLVMQQAEPVSGEALPRAVSSVAATGAYAFGRGAHPVLSGLRERDLSCWAQGHVTFRGAYERGSEWAVIADASRREGLGLAPMVELNWGQGRYVLSQMSIAENLGQDPVADRLLANLLRYLAPGQAPSRLVVFPDDRSGLGGTLQQHAVEHATGRLRGGLGSVGLELALDDADVVLLPGRRRHIQALGEAAEALHRFAERGGWAIVLSLDRDARQPLSDLVGVPLHFRDVGQERLRLLDEARADPLLVGVGNHDLYRDLDLSREKLIERKFLHGDAPLATGVFTSALVHRDITGLSNAPRVLCNGLLAEDHWQYIAYRGDGPLTLRWREAFPIERVLIHESRHYKWMRQLELTLAGKSHTQDVPWDLEAYEPVSFDLPQPVVTDTLTLTPRDIQLVTGRTHGPTGWDLVEVHRRLSDEHRARIQPLTDPAGLVKFPLAHQGGILLNLTELNHPLSVRILLQLLHNLDVSRSASAGAELGELQDVHDFGF